MLIALKIQKDSVQDDSFSYVREFWPDRFQGGVRSARFQKGKRILRLMCSKLCVVSREPLVERLKVRGRYKYKILSKGEEMLLDDKVAAEVCKKRA